jgi:hypothetical protein
MAQRVMLIDDLDGSEGAETIKYSVDGQEYEIDLSEENAERFRSMLKEFIDVSREVEQPPGLTLAPVRIGRRQSSGGGRDDSPAQAPAADPTLATDGTERCSTAPFRQLVSRNPSEDNA